MKIHFDLSGEDAGHRREWEARLGSLSPSEAARIVSDPAEADWTVRTPGPQLNQPGLRRHFGRAGEPPPRTVLWDAGDFPTGRWPGFYCSLSRPLFDPKRHRSFCYPIEYNELVALAEASEATHLYGFVGAISSGLRARLLAALAPSAASDGALVKVQGGPWDRMFDRSGVPAKQDYADSLRRCRFFICPRGNGVGSVRLFETLKAGRVPVIIADRYVLPEGIDWDSCSVRVRERDIGGIPEALRGHLDRWPGMAAEARRVWERHFSDAALLGEIARHLRAIEPGESPGLGQRLGYARRVLPALAKWQLAALWRRIRT